MTRREWNTLALTGLATLAMPVRSWSQTTKKPDSKFAGVQIGIQSYSLRDRPLEEAIQAIADVGINSCELWNGHLEPKDASPAEKQQWLLSVPLTEFKKVRQKFDKAGIQLSALSYGFREKTTDDEMDRVFQMAKAMGVNTITSSGQVNAASRVNGMAQKHKIKVGFHNHDNLKDPNEFATPESFARALQGASPYLAINLDIGHFVAANFDPVDYIKKHHERIVMIHLKDRKRDHGDNVPFGEGETPIREVLTLMRDNKYKFPANIEYEYNGADTVAEIKKCLDFCKQALT